MVDFASQFLRWTISEFPPRADPVIAPLREVVGHRWGLLTLTFLDPVVCFKENGHNMAREEKMSMLCMYVYIYIHV